jgi:hypothetical protein
MNYVFKVVAGSPTGHYYLDLHNPQHRCAGTLPLRSAPFRSLIDALFLLLLAGCFSFVSCKR